MSYQVTKTTKLIMFPTTVFDLVIFIIAAEAIMYAWSKLNESQRRELAGG